MWNDKFQNLLVCLTLGYESHRKIENQSCIEVGPSEKNSASIWGAQVEPQCSMKLNVENAMCNVQAQNRKLSSCNFIKYQKKEKQIQNLAQFSLLLFVGV